MANYWGTYGVYIDAPGMSGVDPAQSGLLQNCNLIAAMASCAWTGKGAWFKSVASDEALQSSYPFTMYDFNQTIPQFTTTPEILLSSQTGTPVYARSTTSGESWPGIVEKAYYKSREWLLSGTWTDKPNLEKFNDVSINPTSNPSAVLYHLFGKEVTTNTINTTGDAIFSALDQLCIGRIPLRKIIYPAVACTFTNAASPITAGHTYSILGLAGTKTASGAWATKYIVLRDPKNVTTDPVFSGTGDVLTSGTWVNAINFANRDGIFALRADLFPTYFEKYAYVVC
jgi:hypothetical protein